MNVDYKTFPASTPIVKSLESLMRELHHRMPRVSYKVARATAEQVYEVHVYHDYERVGGIRYELAEDNKGVKHDLFSISSHNIRLERRAKGMGNKNTKQTKLFKNAVKIGIEVFKRTNAKVIADKIAEDTIDQINDMLNQAGSHSRSFVSTNHVDLLAYATGASAMSDKLAEAIKTDGQNRYDNYRIAKAIQQAFVNQYGICIRTEEDGTITVVDMKNITLHMETKSTYDLPTNYQEKFAILKIMEYKQPVEHVGVKFANAPDLYFLVGGETITTC